MNSKKTQIPRINHIAIAVKNLEEAALFYQEQMGLSIDHIEEIEDQKVRVAFIPIGDTRIELVQPTTEDSPISKFLEKRGEGLHHICFETTNVDDSLETMKQNGVRLIDKEVRQGAHNTRIAFLHPKASNGVLIELAELAKE